MKKRILSLCMAAVLALSCILPASAAETQSGLTVRSVTPADLSQTMGNTTQQMTAQPQDPNEVVDILVELDDEPAAAVLEQDGKTYMSSHDEALDVTVSGDKTVTLSAGATGDVKVSVSLSQSQKAKLDAAYENGIYVEGFVVLTAKDGSADLSIPFLAYYGDWSAPGMLDYATMLNEDTVPYSQLSTELGAYFTSSFAYRLGANLSVTMDGAEKTSLKAEHITISPNGDTYMDGVELVNVSQMRSASALHFTVTSADGQEVWSDAVTNVPKTIYVSSQGSPIPATMYQDMAPDAWYGTDNEGSALPDGQYYYTITTDPVTDHESRNVRDTLTFPVYIDTQAPQLDQGCVTLSTGADGRTALGMQVSDEHLYLDTEYLRGQ